ncbi:MAG TPA: hypothetical protein VF912_15275 [Anaeromyxobacter sp.]
MNRIARAAVEILRLTFAHEAIGEPPSTSAPGSRRAAGRLLRAVFAPETLAMDPPEAPRESRGILHWIFAPEQLPLDPEPAAKRTSRLAALFAPEKLDDSR